MNKGNEQKVNWNRFHEKIVKMYRDGDALRTIAEEFKVSHVTICKRLDQWNIPRRNGDKRRGILVKDLSGQRFGRLTIVTRRGVSYPVKWIVRCDCGNVRCYTRQRLYQIRSCGCAPRGPSPKKSDNR